MSSNPNASTRRGPKVRGTCNAGHVTERNADPGRVTWNGPCAKDGCDLSVRARRVPAAQGAAPAQDDPTPEPAAESGSSVTVKEVDYDHPQPKRQRQHAPRVVEPDDGPGDPAPAAPAEQPAVQRGDSPDPVGHVEPAAGVVGDSRHAPERRPRRRWTFRTPFEG